MAPINMYVRVGNKYVKFTSNNGYRLVDNRIDASGFTTKMDLRTACRNAGIETFKIVKGGMRRVIVRP